MRKQWHLLKRQLRFVNVSYHKLWTLSVVSCSHQTTGNSVHFFTFRWRNDTISANSIWTYRMRWLGLALPTEKLVGLTTQDRPTKGIELVHQSFCKRPQVCRKQLKSDFYVSHCRSLEIKKVLLGWNHPDVAIALINLSNLSLNIEDYENAERYAQQAWAIYQVQHWCW